jgi:protein phosphatase 1 regulatory subunit 7
MEATPQAATEMQAAEATAPTAAAEAGYANATEPTAPDAAAGVETPEEEADASDPNASSAPGRGDGPAERRARVDLPPVQEDDGPTYYRIGIDHTYEPDEEEIHFQCTRIRKLENLEAIGPKLKSLILIANCIEKIENLETNVNLEHLELYQNLVKKIDKIDHLTKLTTLDLSFNKIRSSAYLAKCPFADLGKLYLSCNKIEDMEGYFHFTKLKMLELGSNRIRVVHPDLANLVNLEELWLGKNKIASMALPPLPKLRHLSMQNNRLEVWDSSFFTNACGLTNLYLGFNNLPDLPEDFTKLVNLKEVDLAKNAMQKIRPLPELEHLEEFWMNDCQVSDLAEVRNLSTFPGLKTVYLERNPMHGLGDEQSENRYKEAILQAVPNLEQLDAVRLNGTITVITDGSEKSVVGIRKR